MENQNQGLSIGGAILILGSAAGIYYIYSRNKREKAKTELEAQVQDNSVQQAQSFFTACISWSFGSFHITKAFPDRDLIFSTARQVTNWANVQKAFQTLYNENLMTLLQNVLSASDYQYLLNIINGGVPQSNDVKKVYAKRAGVSYYKEYPNKQPIALSSGQYVGYTYPKFAINISGRTLLQVHPNNSSPTIYMWLDESNLV